MRTLQEIISTPLPELKVGDKVWNPRYGFGSIIDIHNTYVQTTHGLHFYKDGKISKVDTNRSLFTAAEAAELGFVDCPIGKLCAFWDDNNKNRIVVAKLLEYTGNSFWHEMDTGKLRWKNCMELNEFLANKELMEKLNLA